jgi:hypothetical protein
MGVHLFLYVIFCCISMFSIVSSCAAPIIESVVARPSKVDFLAQESYRAASLGHVIEFNPSRQLHVLVRSILQLSLGVPLSERLVLEQYDRLDKYWVKMSTSTDEDGNEKGIECLESEENFLLHMINAALEFSDPRALTQGSLKSKFVRLLGNYNAASTLISLARHVAADFISESSALHSEDEREQESQDRVTQRDIVSLLYKTESYARKHHFYGQVWELNKLMYQLGVQLGSEKEAIWGLGGLFRALRHVKAEERELVVTALDQLIAPPAEMRRVKSLFSLIAEYFDKREVRGVWLNDLSGENRANFDHLIGMCADFGDAPIMAARYLREAALSALPFAGSSSHALYWLAKSARLFALGQEPSMAVETAGLLINHAESKLSVQPTNEERLTFCAFLDTYAYVCEESGRMAQAAAARTRAAAIMSKLRRDSQSDSNEGK